MALANIVLMDSGIRYRSPFLNFAAYVTPLLIVMPVGPLLYFYVLANLNRNFKVTKFHVRHFYSTIFDLLPYLAGIVLLVGLQASWITNEKSFRSVIDEYNGYADIFRWLSLTVYLVIISRRLRDADLEDSKWLRQLVAVFTAFQVIWLLHMMPYLWPGFGNDFITLVTWYPIYLPLSVVVYWLTINGYLRLSKAALPKAAPLSDDTAEHIFSKLVASMESERLYLDAGMTLAKLASHIGVNQKIISAVLNQHKGLSFNQFLNSYRVEELKRRLRSPGHRNLTITGLGMECGFNSSATMQRAFRQLEKCSPRAYQLKSA